METDLFGPVKNVSKEKWHTKFKLIKEDPCGEGEREVLRQWVKGLVDRDHNIVEKFQKTFHASFWEFYLYACFKEAGLTLDQNHNRPDFMITSPYEINVEAVVANIKDHGRPESDRGHNDLMDMFIPPKNQNDFYEIQHEAIARHSNAITSKIKKYENEYSKCEWIKPEVPFVIAMSSYGQVNYGREFIYPMMTLLYGMYYIAEQDKYERVIEVQKIGSNSTIPVGLFTSDKNSKISAVLYSCTTTLGKLKSMAISAGYPSLNEVFNLRRDYEDSQIPYKVQIVSENSPECLTDGLFIFHNPYAKNKIDITCFENTNITQFFWKNGRLVQSSNTFPIVCRLNIPRFQASSFKVLIDEYVRQYNNLSPIEFYCLDPTEKMELDFKSNCLVCIWIIIRTGQMLNIHYTRPQFLTDGYLEEEAMIEVKNRSEDIVEVNRIDIIRNKKQFEIVNQ